MAGKLGKPCREPRCAEIVTGPGRYCEKHTVIEKQERGKWATTERLDFYGSARWQRLRTLKLSQNPICEVCNQRFATQVHHLQKARENPTLRFEMSNLQSICVWCHAKETQRETVETRMKSKGNTDGN